jgi:hypothetical protein
MYSISRIAGIEQCIGYCEFYQRVLKTALLATMLTEITKGQNINTNTTNNTNTHT